MKKFLITLLILSLPIFVYANWNSSGVAGTNTVAVNTTAEEANFKAIDGTSGTAPTTVAVGTQLQFEGATADAFETILTVTDPTADRTITLPNITGTVLLNTDTANQVLTGASPLVFEGATADAYETTITITDPTADRIITIPNLTGGLVLDANDQTIAGVKTFSSIPVLPASNPTSDNQAARKAYVDSQVGGVTADITDVGDVSSGAAFSGTQGNTLYFEGATVDAYETALTATDPTADRVITLPNHTGTVAVSGADFDLGTFELRANTLQSDVATGTAPLTVASTTKVSNLNADTVDGYNTSTTAVESKIPVMGASGYMPDASVDATALVAPLGAWVDKSSSYGAQQAATDGFVVIHNQWGYQGIFYTDANANPTTERARDGTNAECIMCPVKKGDYWKFTTNGGTPTVYWIPLGS